MSQATTTPGQKLGNYSDAQYHRLVQAMQAAFLEPRIIVSPFPIQ